MGDRFHTVYGWRPKIVDPAVDALPDDVDRVVRHYEVFEDAVRDGFGNDGSAGSSRA